MIKYTTFTIKNKGKGNYENVTLPNLVRTDGYSASVSLGSAVQIRGFVDTFTDLDLLPDTEKINGYTYGVRDEGGTLYIFIVDFNGISGNNIWYNSGTMIDFSDYVTTIFLQSNYYDNQEVDDKDEAVKSWVLDQNYALNSSLSNYVTTSSLTTQLLNYVTNSNLTSALSNYVLSSNLTSNYHTITQYQAWVNGRGYLQTSTLIGTGNRLLQADSLGNVTASLTVEDLYLGSSDTSIISAVIGATYNSVGIANISAGFKRGRIYIETSTGYRYEAVQDDVVLRTKGV